MPLYTIPNMTGGIDQTIVEVTQEVPGFIIGFLIFIWAVIFISGSAAQKRRTGFADAPLWATMASLSCMLITLMMTLTFGMVGGELLAMVVAITIFSGIWLFLSKSRGEQ